MKLLEIAPIPDLEAKDKKISNASSKNEMQSNVRKTETVLWHPCIACTIKITFYNLVLECHWSKPGHLTNLSLDAHVSSGKSVC